MRGAKTTAAKTGQAGQTPAVHAHTDTASWGRVCERFRQEYGDNAYDTWIKRLGYIGEDGDTVELAAPTKFIRDWISREYSARLKDFFLSENGRIKNVQIRLRTAADATTDQSLAGQSLAGQTSGMTQSPSGQTSFKSQTGYQNSVGQVRSHQNGRPNERDAFADDTVSALDPRYTFDSFVVGKSNELAYAAAKRIAEASDIPFNPLFLHGGVGLGKTHLMHAIAWEVRRLNPQRRVVYVSAERFMYEFVSAVRYKDTHAFKQRYRSVDLLMVDDVQFIGNKESTQDEFFHTFNALVDNRCQVVITADRSPTDLEGIEDRIISRLGWGLVADIHPTDYELRLGILQSKAEQAVGVDVPADVLEFLARRITSNVRELEGALNRVTAYATLVGRPITMDMTRDVLQDLIRANDRKLTIDEVQRTVTDFYNLRLTDMTSERRSRAVARPRQIAMYLSKQLTTKSLPDIGRRFGGRDHTTVMYAVRKIEDLRRSDSQLDEDITRLTRLLES